MKGFLTVLVAVLFLFPVGLANAASKQKEICLKVKGEKVEVLNLAADPIVIDREGIPDFVATSMLKSVSTAKESKSYNIILTGVKRNDKKAIISFDVKIDDKTYAYPKDACKK